MPRHVDHKTMLIARWIVSKVWRVADQHPISGQQFLL